MYLRIENLEEKKLIGMFSEMSFAENTTGILWRDFMARRKEIQNATTRDLISMQIYPQDFDFSPHKKFIKWACQEVSHFQDVPDGMEKFILSEGLYAVFLHKGSSMDNSTFFYIFQKWLPESDYELDNRPHFEILGEKYKNNDPSSEEEIWIPVKAI